MIDGNSRCPHDAASHCALSLNGRPILEFLRALVAVFRAGQFFVPRINGFGGPLLDVTNLMGKVTSESVRWFAGTRVAGRRRLNGEIRMLVTEQDAVMNKRCAMIRLRRESRPFAFKRSHPGRKARVKSWLYKMFFPRPHYQMRRNFFRCQASGCMMWRWATKDPPPSEPRKGYCGLAGGPFTVTAR
jgi:hypothetical protein